MRLGRLQDELQAAKRGELEELLLTQVATIEGWIANSEKSFNDATSEIQRSVGKLGKELAGSPNWKAKKRIEKQLKAASGRLEKLRGEFDEDFARLRNYKETVKINIQIVRGDVTGYTEQLQKEIEYLSPEIEQMAEELRIRLQSQSSLKVKHFFINVGKVLGVAVASPLILVAAAAFGVYKLGETIVNKIRGK